MNIHMSCFTNLEHCEGPSWLASKQTYLGELIFIPTFEDLQDKNSTTSIGSLTCGLISFSVEGDCFSPLS